MTDYYHYTYLAKKPKRIYTRVIFNLMRKHRKFYNSGRAERTGNYARDTYCNSKASAQQLEYIFPNVSHDSRQISAAFHLRVQVADITLPDVSQLTHFLP